MMKRLLNYLFKRKVLMFLVVFTIKIFILSFLIHSFSKDENNKENFVTSFVFKSSDYTYFLQPVDNYFDIGEFCYTKGQPYAGRMPIYWLIYWGFRCLLSKAMALNALILLQVIVSSLAALTLANLSYLLTNKSKVYWITLLITTVSLYTISYDIQTQTESLAVSTMVFFLYFYFKFIKNRGNINLFLAGLFLAFSIFLRLFLGIILPIVCLFICFHIYYDLKRIDLKAVIIKVLIFISCFLIFDSSWVLRNYFAFKKIIPLETPMEISYGKLYSKPWLKTRSLIVSLGENPAYFEPNTLGKWFKNDRDTNNYSFKSNILFGLSFNADSLKKLKNYYLKYKQEVNPVLENVYANYVETTSDRYKSELKAKKKWEVNFKNPIMRFRNFIFTSGSSYLLLAPTNKMNIFEKGLKLIASGYYYLILFFSLVFVLWRAIRLNNYTLKHFFGLGSLIVLSNILVIIFISDIQENRYFMPVFPVLIVFASISLDKLLSFLKMKLESSNKKY